MKKILLLLLIVTSIWDPVLPTFATFSALGAMTSIRFVILITIAFKAFTVSKTHNKSNNALNNTITCFVIIISLGLIESIWAIDTQIAQTTGIIYVVSFLTIILTALLIENYQDIIYIARIFMLNALILSVMGIYESFSGHYIFYNTTKENYIFILNEIGKHYPLTIFFNINNMATFLVLSIPISFVAFEELRHSEIARVLFITPVILCVFLSDSRIALLTVVLFLLLYNLLFKGVKRKTIYLLSVLIAVMFFSSFILSSSAWRYLQNLNFNTLSNEDRFAIWQNSINNSARNYFMGWGFGNASVVNYLYSNISTPIAIPHNWFIEILLDFGIIGLITFISWFIYLSIRLWINRIKETHVISKNINTLMFIFCLIFLPICICPSSIKQSYYIFLIFGICVASIKISSINTLHTQFQTMRTFSEHEYGREI